MGFLQASSNETSEEVVTGSLSVFLSSSSGLSGIRKCDVDGVQTDGVSQTFGDSICSSLGDFQRKTSLESSHFSGDTFRQDNPNSIHVSGYSFKDRIDLLVPSTMRDIQTPASRIVGFESTKKDNRSDGTNGVSADHFHAGMAATDSSETEASGSLVRKRMLSPLNNMLFSEEFAGDSIDIGRSNFQTSSQLSNSQASGHCYSMLQDSKKANIGKKNHIMSQIQPSFNLSGQKDIFYDDNRAASMCLTDGPLLEEKDVTLNSLPGCRLDTSRGCGELRTESWMIPVSTKNDVVPLSSSPLGPKFSEKTRLASRERITQEKREVFQHVDYSFSENVSATLSSAKEEDCGIASTSYEDIGFLPKDIRSSSLESKTERSWPFCHDLETANHCLKFCRSFRGLPVRRSLVGSFEESLLSGRLTTGKPAQVLLNFNYFILTTIVLSLQYYQEDTSAVCKYFLIF